MNGLRAVVAAFRAQKHLSIGEFGKARAILEEMYLRYGPEVRPSPSSRIYAHVNLLYALSLQWCGEKAAAIRAYAFVLDQIREGMRWPGRPCSPDELKYIRCYIRNSLLALSSDPDDPAFALASSVASDSSRYDLRAVTRSMRRMFPLEDEQVQHNTSIAAQWEQRRRPPTVQ